MSQGKLIGASIIGGFVIAFLLTAIALNPDFKPISKVLLWQDEILLQIVGPGPILYTDAQGHPHYEGTPIHALILPVGFILTVPIYSVLSYFFLRWLVRNRRAPTEDAP